MARQMFHRRTRSKVDEARDILANVVLCHVPVVMFNFQQKVASLPPPPHRLFAAGVFLSDGTH
jgi:DNA-directed RNA polymerase III subunit RPC2